MKKQMLVTATNPLTFERKVNEFLGEGWRVIPGTTYIALVPGGARTGNENFYSICIEKEAGEKHENSQP